MTYRAVIVAEFEIEAENIAQARLIAKKLRTVGELVGSIRLRNNRDSITYRVTRVVESVQVTRGQKR